MWRIGFLLFWILTRCESKNTINTTVKCTDKGFDPLFTYNNVDGLEANVKIFFGLLQNVSKCSTDIHISRQTRSAVFTRVDFDSGYRSEIPYWDGTRPNCNGTLSNYIDKVGDERLKYETLTTFIVSQSFRNAVVREKKYKHKISCYTNRRLLTSSSDKVIKAFDEQDEIDECALKLHNCHQHATCENIQGSYNCICNYGYRGNGSYCVDRCSEIVAPCPPFSKCYITANDTVGCRCFSGRFYKKATTNSSAECVEGLEVVQVRGIKIEKNYTDEYKDLKSKESVTFIATFEEVLLNVMQRKFGDSVGEVRVTQLRQGSVVVDFAVIFAAPVVEPSNNVSSHLNKIVSEGDDALQSIGVDSSSVIKARVGICPFSYFFYDNECRKIADNTRALLTLNLRNVEWTIDFLDHMSTPFLHHAEQVTTQLQETFYQQIQNASALNLSVHVLAFNQNDIEKLNGVLVSTSIVYFNTAMLKQQDKIKLCEKLHQLKFISSEKDIDENRRGYINFNIVSYDCCFPSTIGDAVFKGEYTYNTSWIGDVVLKQCQYNVMSNFTRTCLEITKKSEKYPAKFETGEEWETFPRCEAQSQRENAMDNLKDQLSEKQICDGDVSPEQGGCVSLKAVFTQIKNLSKVTEQKAEINGTTEKVEESTGLQSSYEVRYIKDIMEDVITKADANQTVKVKDDIILAMSNVLDTDDNIMEKAETTANAATNLVQQIELLSEKLSDTVTEKKPINVTTPNIAALITKVSAGILNESKTDFESEPMFELAVKQDEGSTTIKKVDEVPDMTTVGKISIPKSTFMNLTNFKGTVNIISYRKPTLFRNIRNEERGKQKVDSIIISVSLSENETATGNPAIRLDLVKKDLSATNVKCSYWEVVKDASGKITGGYWSTEGCWIEGYSQDRGIVKCACSHFTNFALLLSPDVQIGRTPLEITIISYIGAILSISGLVLTIIAHVIGLIKGRNSANQRTRLPSKILVSFSISLTLLLILFLSGMDETSDSLTCAVVAGLMHYFMLCVFVWMLVNAISIFQAVVLVFHRYDERMFFLNANIFAWGCPAVIVIVSGVAKPLNYKPDNEKRYCFVDGYPFYFGVLLPVAVILATNLVLLLIIVVSLARRRVVTAMVNKTKESQRNVRIALSCTVLLGLTWVFGLLAVGQLTYTFQLLFCIFNSLQGFFIFLLHTVFNEVLRKRIRHTGTISGSEITSASSSGSVDEDDGKQQDIQQTQSPSKTWKIKTSPL